MYVCNVHIYHIHVTCHTIGRSRARACMRSACVVHVMYEEHQAEELDENAEPETMQGPQTKLVSRQKKIIHS